MGFVDQNNNNNANNGSSSTDMSNFLLGLTVLTTVLSLGSSLVGGL